MVVNEKRLIDANALTEHIKDLPTWFADGAGMFSCIEGYPKGLFCPEDIISSIENAPTVDAVEVVRCKDCKNWGGIVYGGRCKYWSATMNGITHFTNAEDFCSYGEKREV